MLENSKCMLVLFLEGLRIGAGLEAPQQTSWRDALPGSAFTRQRTTDKLERGSTRSCFSKVLPQVHAMEKWCCATFSPFFGTMYHLLDFRTFSFGPAGFLRYSTITKPRVSRARRGSWAWFLERMSWSVGKAESLWQEWTGHSPAEQEPRSMA